MSTIELKNKVLERLETVDKDYLLEEILNLINIESSNEGVFSIPENHKAELEISLKQKQEGKTVTNEFVDQSIKKWLSR